MFYRLSPQAPLAITCLISPPTTSHFDLLTLLLHHSGLLINPPTFQAPPPPEDPCTEAPSAWKVLHLDIPRTYFLTSYQSLFKCPLVETFLGSSS